MTRGEEIRSAGQRICWPSESTIAFKKGAEWADEHPKEGLVDLSQVWHDSSETPQHDALILFQSIYGDILLIRFQDRQSSMTTIQRWAYVDDLLPKALSNNI